MGGLQSFLTVAGKNQDLALNVRENFKEDNGGRESRADLTTLCILSGRSSGKRGNSIWK